MLKDSFYTIPETKSEADSLTASLQLREDHPLYEGHFPGQPVVPGVFRHTPVLRAEPSYNVFDDDSIRVSAVFLKETTPCFKFNGVFRSAE